mmetsp:Transcript_5972/g.16715  ORF Transcript_5972/g.16715 Transcript_5972/m.16715 type:complete len:385 (-) Transcript_5972:461-1615(-)
MRARFDSSATHTVSLAKPECRALCMPAASTRLARGNFFLQVRIHASFSIVGQRGRHKDMLGSFRAAKRRFIIVPISGTDRFIKTPLAIIRRQFVGPPKSHEHLLQRLDKASIQQHVGFIDNEGTNIGKHVNVFGFEGHGSNRGGCGDHQIHGRRAAANGISKGWKVDGFGQTTRHDGQSNQCRFVGVAVVFVVVAVVLLFHSQNGRIRQSISPIDQGRGSSGQGECHANHLLHQFLVGYQNNGPRKIVSNIGRLVVVVVVVVDNLLFALQNVVHERQQIGECFSAARFGSHRHVGEAFGNIVKCLGLHRGGPDQSQIFEALQQCGRLNSQRSKIGVLGGEEGNLFVAFFIVVVVVCGCRVGHCGGKEASSGEKGGLSLVSLVQR